MFSKGAIYVAAIYMDSRRGRRVTGGRTASLESCPGTPTRNIPAFSGPTLALPLDEDGPDTRLFSSPRHSMAGVRIAGQLQVRISRPRHTAHAVAFGLSYGANHAVNLESDT